MDAFAVGIEIERQSELVFQSVYVPLVCALLLGHVLIDQGIKEVLGYSKNVIALIGVLFFRSIALEAHQELTSYAVNSFALFVHHVVIFKQVFSDREVVTFDGF